MKTPTSSSKKDAHSDEQPHNQHYDYDNKYHNTHRDTFPTDRDLIRPAVFVFVCGALVLAIVAIIFLVMG